MIHLTDMGGIQIPAVYNFPEPRGTWSVLRWYLRKMNVIVFWETTILNENSLDVITFLLARVFHYYGLALQRERERDRKSVCVCVSEKNGLGRVLFLLKIGILE